ncbi:MAG: hypothetical protein QXU99_00795 [Candidatus Bathyarchaeia archaeon]
MKVKIAASAVLICFVSLLLLELNYLRNDSAAGQLDVFVGIDAAYDNIESIKALVNEIKTYTNFFVVGSSGVTLDLDKLNDVCQYLNDSGLHFATYTHTTTKFNQSQWIIEARAKWNKYFRGLYTYDEPGGHLIDRDDPFMVITEASNYSDAAAKYVENLRCILSEYKIHDFPLLTSDYALYEFDYRGGYDVVLVEYAWNHSRSIHTALCRGAATMHGKEWGVMITYTYTAPPYLASGEEIFADMVNAYQNGAKYIVVFDYAKDPTTNSTYGILQQEHLDALKQFWQYAKTNPRKSTTPEERVAYVLPKDYGYGFRGTSDWIWGLFNPDNQSSVIWLDVSKWVENCQPRIDIIYEDTLYYATANYSKLVFWNGTMLTK